MGFLLIGETKSKFYDDSIIFLELMSSPIKREEQIVCRGEREIFCVMHNCTPSRIRFLTRSSFKNDKVYLEPVIINISFYKTPSPFQQDQ